jgi:hypothetical protein
MAQKCRFPQAAMGAKHVQVRITKKRHIFFATSILKMHHFAKTGSGQT